MGWHAARKLRRALEALSDVLAIELLAASRALALRAPLEPSAITATVRDRVNEASGGPGHDRWLAPSIAAVGALVRDGTLLELVGTNLAEHRS